MLAEEDVRTSGMQDTVTAVWVSPDGDRVAVEFQDGRVGIQSRGGSCSPGAAGVSVGEMNYRARGEGRG